MNDMNLFVEVLDPEDGYTPSGRLKGQGRKGKAFEEEVRKQLESEGDIPYQVARARKEQWEAKLKELEYETKLGQKVDRTQVREVCATAMASFVQACRSIGDLLERRYGVDTDTCQVVSNVIDEALDELADQFKMLGGE